MILLLCGPPVWLDVLLSLRVSCIFLRWPCDLLCIHMAVVCAHCHVVVVVWLIPVWPWTSGAVVVCLPPVWLWSCGCLVWLSLGVDLARWLFPVCLCM